MDGCRTWNLSWAPSWQQLLESFVPQCEASVQRELNDLLSQGRLRTVFSFIHRHLGEEPLQQRLQTAMTGDAEQQELTSAHAQTIETVAQLPWRAVFTTIYADVMYRAFERVGQAVDVLTHTDAHHLSLRTYKGPFILRAPPSGRSMRADAAFFELVEEIVRTRTLFFLGFDIDDPDLHQILELLGRIGRGNRHYAWLPYITGAEAEELEEQFGIHVLHGLGQDLGTVAQELLRHQQHTLPQASAAEHKLPALDLRRLLRSVDVRADLALDAALAVDPEQVAGLLQQVGDGGYQVVDPGALLRAGSVFLAHERLDEGRRLFQRIISRGTGREYQNVARLTWR